MEYVVVPGADPQYFDSVGRVGIHQREINRWGDGAPVWCENNRASLFDNTQDAVPQEASGFGVHPGGRLILQQIKHPAWTV